MEVKNAAITLSLTNQQLTLRSKTLQELEILQDHCSQHTKKPISQIVKLFAPLVRIWLISQVVLILFTLAKEILNIGLDHVFLNIAFLILLGLQIKLAMVLILI